MPLSGYINIRFGGGGLVPDRGTGCGRTPHWAVSPLMFSHFLVSKLDCGYICVHVGGALHCIVTGKCMCSFSPRFEIDATMCETLRFHKYRLHGCPALYFPIQEKIVGRGPANGF
jgi:hypothetical protein